jgi:hypothetical protein
MANYNKLNIYENSEDINNNKISDIKDINISKTNIRLYKLNIICNYIFLLLIIILQAITLHYFMMVSNILEQLDNININQINIYINKTKTIVDYVCDNLVKC